MRLWPCLEAGRARLAAKKKTKKPKNLMAVGLGLASKLDRRAMSGFEVFHRFFMEKTKKPKMRACVGRRAGLPGWLAMAASGF